MKILRSANIHQALRSRQRGFLLAPGRFGSGPPTDPYYALRGAILHGNGANASITLTDNAPSPKTYTANGNAQISTAQSVFNGSSMLLDGAGDYWSTPNHADFNFGTGDYQIQCKARFASLVDQALLSTYQNSTNGWSLQLVSGKLAFNLTGDGVDSQGVTTISTGVWSDIEAGRVGTTQYLFLDGTLEDSDTNASSITSTAIFAVGRLGALSALYFNGNLAEVRIGKGVPCHTGPFSPSSAPYPDA